MSQQPDLNALLEQASLMQEQLMAAQAEAAERVVEGSAGGGAVKVRVNGGLDFESVSISPDAVDAADVAMLEDLVLAALHDAVTQIREVQEGAMGQLGLGEAGGGGLGGLLGG